MSAARRDLDWSAESARLLFDGDDAILHNTGLFEIIVGVLTPYHTQYT